MLRILDYYQTQYKILKSRSLAKAIILEMNLLSEPEFNPLAQELKNPAETAEDTVPSKVMTDFCKMLKFNP